MFYAASNVLICDLCFCFKTYSVVQRFATSSSAFHAFFFPKLYNVSGCLSIAGWKIIRTGCVCVQHKRKSRSRCKKYPKHRLKYDSSVYLPDFLYISSFRIFSPLCCCSRVCPVEFFNFSLSRLIYENGFITCGKKNRNTENVEAKKSYIT